MSQKSLSLKDIEYLKRFLTSKSLVSWPTHEFYRRHLKISDAAELLTIVKETDTCLEEATRLYRVATDDLSVHRQRRILDEQVLSLEKSLSEKLFKARQRFVEAGVTGEKEIAWVREKLGTLFEAFRSQKNLKDLDEKTQRLVEKKQLDFYRQFTPVISQNFCQFLERVESEIMLSLKEVKNLFKHTKFQMTNIVDRQLALRRLEKTSAPKFCSVEAFDIDTPYALVNDDYIRLLKLAWKEQSVPKVENHTLPHEENMGILEKMIFRRQKEALEAKSQAKSKNTF